MQLLVNSEPRALHDDTDLAAAMRELDGNTVSELMLESSEDTFVTVGGGAGGLVSLELSLRGDLSHLVDVNMSESELVEMVFLGQRTQLPRRYLVSKETALTALLFFVKQAGQAPGLTWES